MLRALWPGVAVTDNAITQVVSELRQALGDEPASPRFVETVPRRGYRFIGVVESLLPAPVPSPGAGAPAPSVAGTRSIAGLPFSNVTRGRGVAWLFAGISEALTHNPPGIRALRASDPNPPPPPHSPPPPPTPPPTAP